MFEIFGKISHHQQCFLSFEIRQMSLYGSFAPTCVKTRQLSILLKAGAQGNGDVNLFIFVRRLTNLSKPSPLSCASGFKVSLNINVVSAVVHRFHGMA